MSGTVGKNAGRASGIVGAGDIGADAVDSSNIADDAIDSEHYTDGSIDNAHIGDNAIDSEHYAAGSIDLEHMSSESVDEDNLHISNSGSNGNFLSKQSGDAGGLTWAAAGATTDVKFQAYPSSGATNVTGAGTAYVGVYDTEVFDTANAFDGTSTFTAPETGKYLLTVTMAFSGVTAASDGFQISIITSNRTYITPHVTTNTLGTPQVVRNSTVIADMDLNDTAVVSVVGTGESGDVWDFENSYNNVFFGALLA